MAPHRVGIIHVHAPVVYRALRPSLLISRRKKILHVHLDYTDEELIQGLALPPDLIIVCAEFIRHRVNHLICAGGADRTRVVTIRNAVDTVRFCPGNRAKAKSDLGVDPQRPVVLMAANLAKHKGQETAIRAIAGLVRSGYKPLLWLAGEQRDPTVGYAKQLKELAVDLDISELVHFLGMRKDVDVLLRASDFLLLPSTQEGLPLVILEAQASGTVVLAAPTAGIPEVIEDGRTGFLIPADDFETYADRLRLLIDRPDVKNRVSEAALEQIATSFTFADYIRQILVQYDALLL
jgi:glycosyltransferase involved in cell wall biosynthesis